MKEPAIAFPWETAMEFGFGILGLSARDFWQLTPRELNAAIRAHSPLNDEPVSREWLEGAMKSRPDMKGEDFNELN